MTQDITELLERRNEPDATFTGDEVTSIVDYLVNVAVNEATADLRLRLEQSKLATLQTQNDMRQEARRIAREDLAREPLILQQVVIADE